VRPGLRPDERAPGDAAEQRRHLGARLREAEDVVDEEQHVLALVAEVDPKEHGSAEGSKCALVYGQMNEPPGARARVALTGW
jgi:F-type H+-transporting ATPase subunit beta